MEKDFQLMQYIAQKREFEANGWKVFWIFESFFLEHQKELYGKKMLALEDRIDTKSHPKKLGDFLMCSYVKKHFEEAVTGEFLDQS